MTRLENLYLPDDEFGNFDVERIEVPALLFQTGYLTIEGSVEEAGIWYYKLGYPNFEVESSLLRNLLVAYSSDRESNGERLLGLSRALRGGSVDEFFEEVKVIFAGIPYEIIIKREDYFNSLFYLCLRLAGLDGEFEVMTSRGRLDCALELKDKIYIFEFKIDEDPGKCIEQIREKGYHEKYQKKGKPIYLVGVSYSSEEKNISDWVVEEL